MKKTITVITSLAILLLLVGGVMAAEKNFNLKNTADVIQKNGEITIDGKKVATIDEYNTSDCINEQILSKDNDAIIKHIVKNNVKEVTSVDDPTDVYEFLTEEGMYYTFGKDGKFYIVTINQDQWHGDMLSEMDDWCLENAK